ncbi:rhomboid family intramembrane serine protease [Clostridium bovifaecis]|uniref:Rhomboid family intramembrane serine protease n=1 Tax=Clostridium bovifaecis TaxID=2184719 RepID=A0A6I6F8W5_9CLOT|nr:rhomboid family intramembrane serine protease [Clostridium bovifaecis]
MFNKYYNYSIEEFKTLDNSKEIWGMSNTIGEVKNYVVFLEEDNINNLDISFIHNNYPYNVRIIRVLMVDSSKRNSNWHLMAEGFESDLIVLDEKDKKVLYYSPYNETLAAQIDHVLDYKKKLDHEKRINRSSKITIALILINIIMYAITAFFSGNILDSDVRVLIYLGANENTLISSGEYYRLFTSMFLHGGLLHLVLNMYALNALGPAVERAYGKVKYLIIYLIGGIIASISSYLFSGGVSIGASGAIFALLGAVLVLALKARTRGGKEMLKNILSVVAINVFIGFALPNIDNFAHIGGLVGGSIISWALAKKDF